MVYALNHLLISILFKNLKDQSKKLNYAFTLPKFKTDH
jgi:hypothetical protein